MKWGHKVADKDGPREVTRAEFNEAFGAYTPEEPFVPLEHVWNWFWLLNARRQPGFESPSPITYEQVHSWSVLTRTIITPSEVELLMAMDDVFLEQVSIERKGKRERDESESKSKPKTRKR
jgi:hypothetical protein